MEGTEGLRNCSFTSIKKKKIRIERIDRKDIYGSKHINVFNIADAPIKKAHIRNILCIYFTYSTPKFENVNRTIILRSGLHKS